MEASDEPVEEPVEASEEEDAEEGGDTEEGETEEETEEADDDEDEAEDDNILNKLPIKVIDIKRNKGNLKAPEAIPTKSKKGLGILAASNSIRLVNLVCFCIKE